MKEKAKSLINSFKKVFFSSLQIAKKQIAKHKNKGLDICCRFNGGANAGHTIVAHGKKFATHLLPSGILTASCMNVLGNGMVIHLQTLFKELDTLSKVGSN